MIDEIEYITENYISDLHTEVNKMIKLGWQPFGSIFVHEGEEHFHYIQAMVKYGNGMKFFEQDKVGDIT